MMGIRYCVHLQDHACNHLFFHTAILITGPCLLGKAQTCDSLPRLTKSIISIKIW